MACANGTAKTSPTRPGPSAGLLDIKTEFMSKNQKNGGGGGKNFFPKNLRPAEGRAPFLPCLIHCSKQCLKMLKKCPP
jgi:hypothetical protein